MHVLEAFLKRTFNMITYDYVITYEKILKPEICGKM